jgi:hypothetical protein
MLKVGTEKNNYAKGGHREKIMLKAGTEKKLCLKAKRKTFVSLRVGTTERIWKRETEEGGTRKLTLHPEKKLRRGRLYDF